MGKFTLKFAKHDTKFCKKGDCLLCEQLPATLHDFQAIERMNFPDAGSRIYWVCVGEREGLARGVWGCLIPAKPTDGVKNDLVIAGENGHGAVLEKVMTELYAVRAILRTELDGRGAENVD